MSDNKRYFWLKLNENFFKGKHIKKLRTIAGGDTFTIIYLKLMLLSLKEGGKILHEDFEEHFADEIALEIDEDKENIKLTLNYLYKHGLITEIKEKEYDLPEAQNSIGSEVASAQRVRRMRLRNKQKALQCNTGVTKSNTEIEIELDKEIDKEIKKTSYISSNVLLETWNNNVLGLIPKIRNITKSRYEKYKLRINEGMELNQIFVSIKKSNFLQGENEKKWHMTFDWLIENDKNWIKIIEGNYADKFDPKQQIRLKTGAEIIAEMDKEILNGKM